MKRFMKFCLLLAAALGVIGVAGIGIGMAMGARPAQFLNLAHYDGSIFWWMKNGNERLEERVESWSDNVEDNVEQWSEDLEDDLDDWSNGWGHHWEDDWEQGGAHHGWDGVAAGTLDSQPPCQLCLGNALLQTGLHKLGYDFLPFAQFIHTLTSLL